MHRIMGIAPAMLLACAMATHSGFAQSAESKTAEQVFKNIVQLKGTPADQLQPAMQFISASLGVDCTFCHVQGDFAADDKNPKKTARSMMAMTAMINKESFGGRQQVTCNSCHRGATHPVNTPAVLDSDAEPKPAIPAPAATGATAPTAEQIIDKYISAVGGADAIRKVTSRVGKGAVIAEGKETPIELFTKAPNLRLSITRNPATSSLTAFDGSAGWMGTTGRAPREMSPAESWAAGIDAEFYLPLRLKEMFPQLRRGRPETINGAECEVVTGTAPGHPPVRLDFDAKTGLLVRLVRYAETPMGRNATQIDYSDYREAGGVKIPFRWTLSRPVARFTIQLSEVKTNVDVDAARFAKPAGEVK
jgi:photosynthetic reaction center cytochrome c subunit